MKGPLHSEITGAILKVENQQHGISYDYEKENEGGRGGEERSLQSHLPEGVVRAFHHHVIWKQQTSR